MSFFRSAVAVTTLVAGVAFGAAAPATATVGGTHASRAAAPVTAAPAPPSLTGIAYLNTQVDLPPGVRTDIPVAVNLPWPGTYQLDANVRGRLAGLSPVNAFITARLWDATSGVAVANSERLVYQVIGDAGTGHASGNATAPINEVIHVNGPTTIRLQAMRIDATGSATIAQIYSDTAGFTSLRYTWVSP